MAKPRVNLTDEAYRLLTAESMKRKNDKEINWAMSSIVSDLVIKELGKE